MSKAQLFITCLGDQFYTSKLQNMTHILERLGVELTFPPEQTCCGQPLFNNGFEDKTRPVAMNFMRAFAKSDAPIIAPSGSCVSMASIIILRCLKKEPLSTLWLLILPHEHLSLRNI